MILSLLLPVATGVATLLLLMTTETVVLLDCYCILLLQLEGSIRWLGIRLGVCPGEVGMTK